MKKKFLFLFSAVMIMVGNSWGQTTGLSGTPAGGNNCATGAGTNGTNSTNIGCGAGNASNGDQNTFVGDHAGFNDGHHDENVGVGYQSLYTLSGGVAPQSTYNIAIGNNALYFTDPTTSSNGWKNSALGHNAGYTNSTGSYNFFGGYQAGYSNTTGGSNVFLGFEAGYYNTSNNNTFTGYKRVIIILQLIIVFMVINRGFRTPPADPVFFPVMNPDTIIKRAQTIP